MERNAGILLHISSLPGRQWCGTLGDAAYGFVDFLAGTGMRFWQILPLCPIGAGDSPYQSLSASAGNELLIDADRLYAEGLIDRAERETACDAQADGDRADFARARERQKEMLGRAFQRGYPTLSAELERFEKENKLWLSDYALFMALKERFGGAAWYDWPVEFKRRDAAALARAREELQAETAYHIFVQYEFYHQWDALRRYANENGIEIIGDMPIYVAEDSVDVWANQQFFELDDDLRPRLVAGCPPDAFSQDGQLWNNPVYRWDVLQQHHYSWWIDRLRHAMRQFDRIRLDHFRGFEAYWAVERGEKTARNGRWMPGPGADLFRAANWQIGLLPVIAEDLGSLTEGVRKLLEETGFPGMKVLQFAFDDGGENPYLPHWYRENCVAYTGTHDNDTAQGWAEHAPERSVAFAQEYLGVESREGLACALIRGVWGSAAGIAIAPMQDFLGLGSGSRMNTPGTVGGNWCWRATPEMFGEKVRTQLLRLNSIYGRCCRKST